MLFSVPVSQRVQPVVVDRIARLAGDFSVCVQISQARMDVYSSKDLHAIQHARHVSVSVQKGLPGRMGIRGKRGPSGPEVRRFLFHLYLDNNCSLLTLGSQVGSIKHRRL